VSSTSLDGIVPEIPRQIGVPWEFPIEDGKVREFARAVQHPGPPDGKLTIPATFPTYGSFAYAKEHVVEVLGLDIRRVLHGGEEYNYSRPLLVGQTLVCQTWLIEDYRKQSQRSGTMRFVVTTTEMADHKSGEVVVVVRSTIIAMEGESA
jgi:hypothetical protein